VNPFKYGSIVVAEHFCGRKKLITQIQEHIFSAQNIVIYGERRVGKTSLIYEAIRRQKKFRPLRLDLMDIKSTDTLCRKILHALALLEKEAGGIERFFKSLASLRPVFSIDPITGSPTIGFDSKVPLSTDNLHEIFHQIKKADAQKAIVVVLDEFQSIIDIDDTTAVIAELRSHIQHATNIPFIFAGSIRKKMERIFISENSPFFKSALPLSVKPLGRDEFIPFLTDKFQSGTRTINDDLWENIFDLAGETTGDVQQLCEALWSVSESGNTLNPNHISQAIELLISREILSSQSIMTRLTEFQVKVLLSLARVGGKKPTSKAFLKQTGSYNASSVSKTLKRLEETKIIYQIDHDWKFFNPVFKQYLLKNSAR